MTTFLYFSLLTFAHRARCAAAILALPAALIFRVPVRRPLLPFNELSCLITASILSRSASKSRMTALRFSMRGL